MSISRSLLALLAGSVLSASSLAQPIEPVDPKDRAVKLKEPDPQTREQTIRAVLDRINAEFLTENERADLRVLHGQWINEDLDTPKRAAQIALDLHDFANPIFDNPDTPLPLRAAAALEIGNPAQALTLIEQTDTTTIESAFIRASALELLGKIDQAIEQLEIIESTLANQTIDDAGALAIGCDALIKLTRLRSPQVSAKVDYEAIEALLGMARDRVDRLDWRVRNAEAHLLYEHHNLGEAHTAAIESLRLNPRAAEPMLLLDRSP